MHADIAKIKIKNKTISPVASDTAHAANTKSMHVVQQIRVS